MGVVYRAEDLRLDREVAIKFLRKEDHAHAPWLTRFEREARARLRAHAPAHLHHPRARRGGRPSLHRDGAARGPDDQAADRGGRAAGRAGGRLRRADRRWRSRRRTRAASSIATSSRRTCSSPHDDHLKVLDFGLAKLTDRQPAAATSRHAGRGRRRPHDADVTVTGAAVGTAAYMSPEQATGAKVDARTDLFSFGSVLYEMATGRRAFPGDNSGTVIMRLLKGEFIPPRSLESGDPRAARDHHPPRDGGRSQPALSDAPPACSRTCGRCRARWRRTPRSTASAGAGAPAAGRRPRRRFPLARWVVGVAGIALLAVVGGWRWIADGPGDRAHEQGQHPRRRLRQHHGRCGLRRDAGDGAEGPARPVAVPRHRPRRSRRRGAAADAAAERRAAHARYRARGLRAARPQGDARRHAGRARARTTC